ncbi:MAG: arsinothricin resistance N-acetyltransferase ArsN1 [Thermomicrobiales bacterium]|nr:arsinothricin resistance N-acetyltransferase ArsN1 [Thermomicrobiales bacterium]
MAIGDVVRLATVADAARIADIYNQGIEDRIATFETELRTANVVRDWFSRPYPIVVVERQGEVIAWASASEYRPRTCYAQNCEFSVYVDRTARGTGAGKQAMLALMANAASAGFHKLISRVFVENRASLRMLESVGFRQVGVYHQHGQLDGIWKDVVIVEVLLRDRHPNPPTLTNGQHLMVTKTHCRDEKPPIRYSCQVVPCNRGDWIAIRAEWELADTVVAGIRFENGGELIEYFSPTKLYNVFCVHDRAGALTGLYCNVTAPIVISDDGHELVWEDRWLDAVKLPDGTITILDEDEYEASGIPSSDPALDLEIRTALEDLLESLRRGDWDL